MLKKIGLVTGGKETACDLINIIQSIRNIHISFVITKFPLDGCINDNKNLLKIVRINNNKEGDFEYHLGEFIKFPTKEMFFFEYEEKIPNCIKDHYNCYILEPAIKEKTGSWEKILCEVLLTKSDHIGCYVKKDGIPIIYHKISTKDFNWRGFNRKRDITKEDLYFKLQKEVRISMKSITELFFDLLSNDSIKILNNKVYIDNLLCIGGLNADFWIKEKNDERCS